MAEFLLEIFSEEIPARLQLWAADGLKKLLDSELQARGLSPSSLDTYVTPQRLVAVIPNLSEATIGTVEERRGPKVDAPEGAIQGFLKSAGITLEACEQRDGYYYVRIETKPRQTRDILPDVIQAIFAKMVWPKSMFWALNAQKKSQFWVRPVRSVLAIFGGEALSFDIPALGLTASNKTQGHRFLAPDVIEVSSFADYQAKLKKAFVVLDHQERQARIWDALEALAHQKGFVLQPDPSLLQEVAGLVEYPVPLLGQIETRFMSLPAAVLSTSMRVHQKYFTVLDKDGQIAPYFGVVANTKGADGGMKMIAGYERVLRARLSDAAFFYEQDVKTPLAASVRRLNAIVFQEKLGTLDQKSARLVILMTAQGAREADTRAAQFAKADLVTTMVGEFPELQGVMGEIYANAQGETSEIAAAIREHYQPQGPNDQCPTAPLSIALALADKLDTLVGFFGIGEEPTGSKDPFALRRAALGIIRLIRENSLADFSLHPLCCKAVEAYRDQNITFKPDFRPESVLDFINERLKIALRGEGLRHDCVSAVIDRTTIAHTITLDELKESTEFSAIQDYIGARSYNVFSLSRRAKALHDFLGSSNGAALSATFRRVDGIVENEMARDNHFYLDVKLELLREPQEQALHHQLEQIIKVRKPLLDAHDYTGWMAQLATLHSSVDSFFDAIKVNHEDKAIRANRLGLLGKLRIQTELIANFSKIEG
ncbi:MAG: glyS [Alphaproteobacteria bacterium]|jgi:glycyl-tRNA synthetase beta chain|nr:glyS [Alphaproteobacteria bacterium]